MKNPKIKTLDITAKEWFDKQNGNSYFAARITINFGLPNAKVIPVTFQYGYGTHYQVICLKELQKIGYFKNPAHIVSLWRNCEDQKIVLRTNKIEKCLKRDVIEWGS